VKPGPEVTPYELIGGDTKVRALIDRFYDLMDTVPEFYVIRRLHPEKLSGSRDKLYMFLSGWMGGPQLYAEKFGHPMLRARHLPFPIGIAERDAWLTCMRQAMLDTGVEESLLDFLMQSLSGTADWMRNKAE